MCGQSWRAFRGWQRCISLYQHIAVIMCTISVVFFDSLCIHKPNLSKIKVKAHSFLNLNQLDISWHYDDHQGFALRDKVLTLYITLFIKKILLGSYSYLVLITNHITILGKRCVDDHPELAPLSSGWNERLRIRDKRLTLNKHTMLFAPMISKVDWEKIWFYSLWRSKMRVSQQRISLSYVVGDSTLTLTLTLTLGPDYWIVVPLITWYNNN